MPQTKIEEGFQLALKAIELLQSLDDCSFLDAYIETGENILDGLKVRTSEEEVPKSLLREIENVYKKLSALQLEPEEIRKISQYILLKGTTIQPMQSNHQLTPDSLGFLFTYLLEQLYSKQQGSFRIVDVTVGTGNLLLTVILGLQLADVKARGIGVDVDDTLLALASVGSGLTGANLELFMQDGLHPLLIDPADAAIADLPVGYYPDDDFATGFLTSSPSGHSYAHHLLLEQSMNYVKPDGYGIFLLPFDFLQSQQSTCLHRWLETKVYLQAILSLPKELFKSQSSQKCLVIFQNRGSDSKQAAEVLLAELPSLKKPEQLQRFFREFTDWKHTNLQ